MPLVMHDSVRLFYRHFKPYQASHFNTTLFMSDIERLLETRTFRIITSISASHSFNFSISLFPFNFTFIETIKPGSLNLGGNF